MPQMTGLEVAHAVQRLRADLPVLIVSGHITDELRAAVLPLPNVRLMRKEQVVEQLAELVGEMLAGRA
jgi:DNA-binding NarL/FixJ family response regulator